MGGGGLRRFHSSWAAFRNAGILPAGATASSRRYFGELSTAVPKFQLTVSYLELLRRLRRSG